MLTTLPSRNDRHLLPNVRNGAKLVLMCTVALSVLALSACNRTSSSKHKNQQSAQINTKTKFSSKEYGVKSSPRVTTRKKVRKGGGRYQIGKPYKIRGKWYTPKLNTAYARTGMASWYGPNFHGRLTANGEIYDQYALSAAHPTMPLPSYAKVTNLENGSSIVVRVNDRGPYAHGRIIDLSARAAKLLGYDRKGVAKVRVKYIGKAQMDGRDERKLVATYRPPKGQRGIVPGASFPGTMLARATKPKSRTLDSFTTAFTRVGIPQPRPTPPNSHEGIPMFVDSLQLATPAVQYIRKPLAYSNVQGIDARISAAFDQILTPDAENYSTISEIFLGSFN